MIQAIKNRHSHRSFEDREVEEGKLEEILKAAAYSPSARHTYPWSLIVVRDEEIRKELSEVTPYADFVAESPVAVVVTSEETNEWVEDCSIAAEHLQLGAAEQGLGTCWAHIRGHNGGDAEETVKEILSLPDDYRVLCTIAIGYPSEKKSPHSETELQEREIYEGEYGREY